MEKNWINKGAWLVLCLYWILTAAAQQPGKRGMMTPEEFQDKQRAYITEKADLTEKEAAKFFPVYFELQQRKKEINDGAWKLIRKGNREELTDPEYEEILEGIHEARLAVDRLDREYFEKFKRILSCRKIFQVKRAEMRFHREVVRGMRKKHS